MISAVASRGDLLGVVFGCERDLVSERLELSDEALGEPVGVLADEVVAAEVAVQLAGGEHVPGGGQDRVADPMAGLKLLLLVRCVRCIPVTRHRRDDRFASGQRSARSSGVPFCGDSRRAVLASINRGMNGSRASR